MSPERQREEIAKAHGRYKQYVATEQHNPDGIWMLGGASQHTWDKALAEEWAENHGGFVVEVKTELRDLPDYPNDLNACHEMEKVLLPHDSDLWQTYCFWLANVTHVGVQDHATAAERSQCFLRTIGKWEDGE